MRDLRLASRDELVGALFDASVDRLAAPAPRRHARAVRHLVLLALLLCCGCNVIAMREALIQDDLRDAGLRPARVRLGPDQLSYWEGGHGDDVVVLVHGFGASGIAQWPDQVEALAPHHRIVLPDLL